MSLANEEKLLRHWVGQQRPFGRGHTYTPALRRRILAFVDAAKSAGKAERECCKAIGVALTSVAAWRRASKLGAPEEASETQVPEDSNESVSKALVPVEVTPSVLQLGAGLSLVTPRGYRVDGLSLEQAFALLREFE